MNSVLGSALLYCLISSQERANKHKLYLIFNTKQPKIIFNLKSKLNQVFVFVLALRDYQLLCQVSENGNSASNYNYIHPTIYILIFWKLFHIYKLIHIDLKLRLLIASFLLASLLNN